MADLAVMTPIAFGLDKFLDWLVDWRIYLAPELNDLVPGSAHQAMLAVGVIEESVKLALQGEFVPDAVNVQAGGVVAEDVRPLLPLAEKLGLVFTAVADGWCTLLLAAQRRAVLRHTTLGEQLDAGEAGLVVVAVSDMGAKVEEIIRGSMQALLERGPAFALMLIVTLLRAKDDPAFTDRDAYLADPSRTLETSCIDTMFDGAPRFSTDVVPNAGLGRLYQRLLANDLRLIVHRSDRDK